MLGWIVYIYLLLYGQLQSKLETPDGSLNKGHGVFSKRVTFIDTLGKA